MSFNNITPERVEEIARKIAEYKAYAKFLRSQINVRERLKTNLSENLNSLRERVQPHPGSQPQSKTTEMAPRLRLLERFFPQPEPQKEPGAAEVDKLKQQVAELLGKLKEKEKLEREGRVSIDQW